MILHSLHFPAINCFLKEDINTFSHTAYVYVSPLSFGSWTIWDLIYRIPCIAYIGSHALHVNLLDRDRLRRKGVDTQNTTTFLKFSQATYPTSNAKSLACDTANEHALTCTRETCSCSQTAVQWNQWRWSIHMYSNGREHYSDS